MEQFSVVLDKMKRLGFSEYESKAYLKLLENYPVNGYALSKYSGVPRSRIYEVLKNLMEKQMVFEHLEGKSTLYYPVEPQVFLKKLKTDYETIFSELDHFTQEVYSKHEVNEQLVVINGRRNIFDFINLLIKSAEKRISLFVWEEDFNELHPELEKAVERGVLLRGIYLGRKPPYETLVSHRRLTRYVTEKKQRYMSIIVDSSTVLSGIVSRGESSKATWTRDEGFVEMSEDYIAHDLVINLFSASLGKKEYKKFEEFTENVYHHFYHYTDEESSIYKKLL